MADSSSSNRPTSHYPTLYEDETAAAFPTVTGMNIILRSAFLRMILVGTSTVVLVTAVAFFAIGVSELVVPDENDDRTEPVVLAIGGVLLLITSVLQFMSVCVWSGWCSMLPGRGLLLDNNQILVNGQLISVRHNSEGGGVVTDVSSFRPTDTLNGSPKEKMQLLRNVPQQQTAVMTDAATSTRGEVLYLSPRVCAPIAFQEEITPSLRSSFQSFDDIR